MNRIQFGDVNRFLVSIGLILISLSVAIPYLYLSQDFGLYLEQEKVKCFSLTIQNIISEKEAMLSHLQGYIVWTSISILLIGIAFVIVGLFRWFERQSKTDEKENLDIQMRKLEIQRLTPEEKVVKANDEVEAVDIAELIEERNKKELIPNQLKEENVNNYLKVEELIVSHFKKYKTDNFHILDNVKIASNFWVDILLEAKSKEYSDRIIEIKYFSKELVTSLIKKTLYDLDKSTTFYANFYNRKTVPVLIIVFSDNSGISDYVAENLRKKIRLDANGYNSLKRLQICLIRESQIDNFDIKEILKR